MEFQFTEEQEKFRLEVRDFLDEELRKGSFKPRCDGWMCGFSPEFSRKMSERGWIGLCWPKECYGQGKSYMHRMVLTEELLRYGAPVAAHWFGDRQIGPTIIRHGNEEQKHFFLPRIIKAEIRFGMGMSEPEAGSDLASHFSWCQPLPRIHSPGLAFLAASATRATISSQFFVRVRSRIIRASPTPVKWAWLSMKPGMAVRPARSITWVEVPM